MSELLEAARNYLRRGWMPVYVPPGVKGPNQHGWEKLRLTEADLPRHFNRAGNVGIVLGEASGNLVDVDLDCPEALELADQFLPPTPAVTGRPSAPRSHRWYISDVHATKQLRDPKTRKMIVELRSNGGQTLVGPSLHAETGEPYDFLEGDPARVPADALAAAVEAIYEAVVRRRYGEVPKKSSAPTPSAASRATGPDAVERRALAYVDAMPPAISGSGGHAATYSAATALVHGFGLSPDRALQMLLAHYNPRCQPPWTEKELRHKVDDAAAKPHDRPRGWLRDQEQAAAADADVDLSGILAKAPVKRDKQVPAVTDPGPVPDSMLRVPGLISEVMDFTLATAPYPNLSMAFCGALALQAFLAGRKARDAGDNRTNVYLLGLAYSAAGKDWPRKVNTRIVHAVGLSDGLGDRFASGEGIQDALHVTPSMLFQTDEIDGILQSINKAKDARHESVMGTLLTLYSASNTIFPMRRKAGKEPPGEIDQPSLVVFGTAIPNHYYEALSERMLTNGFFARMIIIESGPRPHGQESRVADLPPRVLETAKWWAGFRPGTGGNMEGKWFPSPRLVEHTADAQKLLVQTREEADAEYTRAEERKDAVGTTVWGRVNEQTRKLALIHALSENHVEPLVSAAAVQWARAFVMHQTRRMLFMAQSHVAENPFHAECLKLQEKLREAPDRTLPHSVLLKRMKVDAQTFQSIVATLEQREDIQVIQNRTAGRTGTSYRLITDPAREGNEGGEE